MDLEHDIIIYDNIDNSCLGKAGLHLNARCTERLVMNFMSRCGDFSIANSSLSVCNEWHNNIEGFIFNGSQHNSSSINAYL